MKYKITKQYSQHSEIFCAEFNDLDNALIFITRANNINEERNTHVIYWLFENEKLITNIFNPDTNPKKPLKSKYATNKNELPLQINNPFNVITIVNSKELTVAKFSHYDDAKLFAVTKLNSDDDKNAFYCIFDGNKLIEKLDKTVSDATNQSGEKMKVFRPTPFPNKPRLGPGGYWVDEEDE